MENMDLPLRRLYHIDSIEKFLTIEPDNIQTVLATNFKDYELGTPRRRAFASLLANSILVADGPEWENSRAFHKPSFNRSQVGDLATLEFHVQHLLDAILRDGSTLDLAELFLRYTADVTTDFMFGESISSLLRPDAFGGEMTKACRDVQLLAESRFRLGTFADWVPQPAAYRSVRTIHDYMDSHVKRAIQQRRASRQRGGEATEETGRYIFMNELAKQTEDSIVLRDQLGGIFFAGRDTTATLLSSLFFVLAREPFAWKRLREDVDSLGGRKPTLEELKQLKYLGFCLNETFRLYPIVHGTNRVATKDTVLPKGGGPDEQSTVLVTKATLVAFNFAALHLRKDLWGDDAEDFRPERWEDEKASWEFLLFGGGPRNGIGR
ncbi:MAG: hypothetical protein LQ344_001980 [Seirophora lacunosa]|nr:MAG: hypothetical protein LQ344_001980 [Seirophora lacunosa]